MVKRLNRKTENALIDAEKWAAISRLVTGCGDKTRELTSAWKKLIYNQFHDIIPGSSIAAVYEDSKEEYLKLLSQGCETALRAAKEIALKATTARYHLKIETKGLTFPGSLKKSAVNALNG